MDWLFGSNPLPEPMVFDKQLNQWEQYSAEPNQTAQSFVRENL